MNPAITTQPCAEAQGKAPADFNSAPSDLWLKLFSLAAQCARALGETLIVRLSPEQRSKRGGPDSDSTPILPPQGEGRLHEATPQGVLLSKLLQQQQHLNLPPSTLQKDEEGGREGGGEGEGASGPPPPAPAPPTPYEEATLKLLSTIDLDSKELQSMLKGIVRISRGTGSSRALRMRIAWTATHHLLLPTSLDETWELLLKCLTDVMNRARWRGIDDRELMLAAELGCLFKSERQSWPKNKPFEFDLFSAAALCERADLEMASVVTGLTCLQV